MSIFGGSSVGTMLATGVATVLVFGAGIQLVPYGHAHTNPPVVQEPAWDSARTRQLFMAACADCHTNETSGRGTAALHRCHGWWRGMCRKGASASMFPSGAARMKAVRKLARL